MPVDATVEDVARSIRAVVSPDVTAELTDLLAYASAEVTRIAPLAPIRSTTVLLSPSAGTSMTGPQPGARWPMHNVIRNSGAGAMLLPYRVHRGGSTAAAQPAVT